MSVEYLVLIFASLIALVGWAGRAVLALTKEMTEWRVLLFDKDVGIVHRLNDHEKRIRYLEGKPMRSTDEL